MVLQLVVEHFPEMRMRFDQTGDIGEIFETFTLPSPGLGEGFRLAFESVFERCDSHEDTVHISGNGTRREIPVKILRA